MKCNLAMPSRFTCQVTIQSLKPTIAQLFFLDVINLQTIHDIS